MKNDFLSNEQKCDGVLNLSEKDKWTFGELVDVFDFCMNENDN